MSCAVKGFIPTVFEPAYTGLELHKEVMLEENSRESLSHLSSTVTKLILAIVDADVRSSPDLKIVPWILTARVIILNLSKSRGKDTTAESPMQGDDGEEGLCCCKVCINHHHHHCLL